MPRPHRLIIWSPGDMGGRALRKALEAPDRFEVVGVKVFSPHKNGKDIGELVGLPPTGVKATTSKKEILALDKAYLAKAWAVRAELTDYERRGFAQFFYLTVCGHLEAVLVAHIKARLFSMSAFKWHNAPNMKFKDMESPMSRFEDESEDQIRRNLSAGAYSSARQLHEAQEILAKKASEREALVQEAKRFNERQTLAAEVSNQIGERQAVAAESANQLAKEANRLSKWAIGISIVGCIVAAAAFYHGHA